MKHTRLKRTPKTYWQKRKLGKRLYGLITGFSALLLTGAVGALFTQVAYASGPAFPQSKTINNNSITTTEELPAPSFTDATTAGDLLVASISCGLASGHTNVSLLSPSGWTNAGQEADSPGGDTDGISTTIFFESDAPSTTTLPNFVETSSSSDTYCTTFIEEISGVGTSNTIDTDGTAGLSGSSTFTATTSGDVSQANDLVLISETDGNSSDTYSTSSPWSILASETNGSSDQAASLAYETDSSSSGTASGTISSSTTLDNNGAGVIVALKTSGSGGGTPTIVQTSTTYHSNLSSSSNIGSASYNSATTAGNLLVADVMCGNVDYTEPNASISMGSGWQLGVNKTGGIDEGLESSIYYYPDNPGGITSVGNVGTTPSDSNLYCTIFLWEISGAGTTASIDTSGTYQTTSDSGTISVSTSANTADANDLVLAAETDGSGWDDGGTNTTYSTSPDAFTAESISNEGYTDQPGVFGYETDVSEGTTPSVSFTANESPTDGVAVIVALNISGSGGSGPDLVQSKQVNNNSMEGSENVPAPSFSAASTAGDLLVATLSCGNANNGGENVSWSSPTGWTDAVNYTGSPSGYTNGLATAIFYEPDAASTTTLPSFASVPSGQEIYCTTYIAEFSGVGTSNTTDGTGHAGIPGTSTIDPTASTNTADANDLVIVAETDGNSSDVFSDSSGYTIPEQEDNGSSDQAAMWAYATDSSSGNEPSDTISSTHSGGLDGSAVAVIAALTT